MNSSSSGFILNVGTGYSSMELNVDSITSFLQLQVNSAPFNSVISLPCLTTLTPIVTT